MINTCMNCNIPTESGTFCSATGDSNAKELLASGGEAPDLLTRFLPQTPVIGSRFRARHARGSSPRKHDILTSLLQPTTPHTEILGYVSVFCEQQGRLMFEMVVRSAMITFNLVRHLRIFCRRRLVSM